MSRERLKIGPPRRPAPVTRFPSIPGNFPALDPGPWRSPDIVDARRLSTVEELADRDSVAATAGSSVADLWSLDEPIRRSEQGRRRGAARTRPGVPFADPAFSPHSLPAYTPEAMFRWRREFAERGSIAETSAAAEAVPKTVEEPRSHKGPPPNKTPAGSPNLSPPSTTTPHSSPAPSSRHFASPSTPLPLEFFWSQSAPSSEPRSALPRPVRKYLNSIMDATDKVNDVASDHRTAQNTYMNHRLVFRRRVSEGKS